MQLVSKEQDVAKDFKDYAYGVSHDISAPVRAMVEFSRLLTGDHAHHLDAEGRLYLSLIIESGEKLQKMMAALLDYSRLNTQALPFGAVDCNIAFQDATSPLVERIIASEAYIDREELPTVHGDSTQIEQLFTILLDNALKFHMPGNQPRLKISASRRGNSYTFAIADNGIGIDKKYEQKVFQIFQRLHGDKDYPGIGAGLTLAQKIVRRHGGKIWFDSELGQGTTFFFTIPAGE